MHLPSLSSIPAFSLWLWFEAQVSLAVRHGKRSLAA